MGLIGDKLSRFKVKDVNPEYEIKYEQNQLFYTRVFTWQPLDEQRVSEYQ